MKHIALAIFALAFAPALCHAQKLVDSRDQAADWYVPVNIKATSNGARSTKLNVMVYKDNQLVNELVGMPDKFTLNLDLDNTYTFVLGQEGYRTKSVLMDTHMPKDQVRYAAYDCTVNLEAADKFTHSDPFYLDFPSAIVRWNQEAQGFIPNVGYLTDIQSKMGMLQAQMTPN